MHTHCIQGNEIFEGKPIIYSTGNLYFNGYHMTSGGYPATSPWNYGYMVELSFERGKPVTYSVIPYHLEDGGELLHVYEGQEKEIMLAYIDKLSALLADRKETQRYYDAWCSVYGVSQIKGYPKYHDGLITDRDADSVRDAARIRNRLTCEAHCAMITRAAHLLYRGRLEEAAESVADLRALQKMPL